jgi:hypothetical protein
MNISTSIETQDSTAAKHAGISKLWSPVQFVFSKRSRTHDLTDCELDSEYVFEAIDQGDRGYVTAQVRGVRPDDYILLRPNGKQTVCYQVETIEYYACPSDMWMARLRKV